MNDTIQRFVIEDFENGRFEDSHVEPYVHLRRISGAIGTAGDCCRDRAASAPVGRTT